MRWPDDPDGRRRLSEALLDWVAALDEAEPRPAGLDGSAEAELPDLATALAEVEALRREVALQGRAFARLADTSQQVAEAWEARRSQEEQAETSAAARARDEGRLEAIEGLLGAREGLERSLRTARALRPHVLRGWLGARAREAAFASLLEALTLNLGTADEALRELDVREQQCVGHAFDPETMRAVEAATEEEGAPGAVVAVVRPGWTAAGRVLRPAEVRAVPAKAGREAM